METGLAVIKDIDPIVFFGGNGAHAPILDSLEKEVRAEAATLDIATVANREAIASLAYKVAKTKTGLDNAGKELTEEWRKATSRVNDERKTVRERLQALQDEVRAPLTEWEQADKKRVAALEFKVVTVQGLAQLPFDATTVQIEAKLAELDAIDLTNMAEFTSRAELAGKITREALTKALEASKARDAEKAETARLRAEAAAREKKDNEERIAREAREKAQQEAEAERKRIEEEKFQLEARAKQAEAERVAAAERHAAESKLAEERRVAAEAKAKQDAEEAAARHAEAMKRQAEEAEARGAQQAKDAAEKAERDRLAAVAAEQARVATEQRTAAEEVAKREADRKHVAKIVAEIRDAFMGSLDLSNEDAMAIVTVLVQNKIPHVKVVY